MRSTCAACFLDRCLAAFAIVPSTAANPARAGRSHGDQMAEPFTDDPWPTLGVAHARYLATVSPYYDDVLRDVASTINDRGDIGKTEIGALLFWKRLRANTPWVGKLHAIPDAEVRAITARAVEAVNDLSLSLAEAAARGRGHLDVLPGFRTGNALASALLTAAAPTRMAVYDRRAKLGLLQLGVALPDRKQYRTYIAHLSHLLGTAPPEFANWVPRDLDLALYTLGGRNGAE